MTWSFPLARLHWRARLAWRRRRGATRTRDMSSLTRFYEQMWRDAACALSATVTEVSPALWRVGRGARSTLIQNYMVQIDDPVTLNIAGDKLLCHRILAEAGLPVPEHVEYTLRGFEAAASFLARHPDWWFVVKPAAGTSGARGVTTHIRTIKECRRASVLASFYGDRILIERWVPGESYRLLFLDGEMIHASRRRGSRVVGDGHTPVRGLIARQAPSTAPQASPHAPCEIVSTLNVQGLDLSSVVERGRRVVVRSTRAVPRHLDEMRTVFDEQATEDIAPVLCEQAARAVRAIGSRFAGVDLITTDPARALEATGGVINEINTTPGLHHHYGLEGEQHSIDPAVRVLARLLGIPVAARDTSAASIATPHWDDADCAERALQAKERQ